MKTKFLALLMALTMLVSLMPMATAAAQAPEEPGEGIVAEAGAQPVETQAKGDLVGSINVLIEDKVEPEALGVLYDGPADFYENDTALDVLERVASATDLNLVAGGGYVGSIKGLGAGAKGEASPWGGLAGGWMARLDGWFTAEGLTTYTAAGGHLLDGGELSVVYSANMGVDYGGDFGNNDKHLTALVPSAGSLSPTFDTDRDQYTLAVPSYGADEVKFELTPANRNFQVRLYSGGKEYRPFQAVPVSAGTLIEVRVGDPAWPSMNNGPYGSGAENEPAQSYYITVEQVPAERPTLGAVTVSIEDTVIHGNPAWPAPLGVMARGEVPLYAGDTALDLAQRLAEKNDLTFTSAGGYIKEVGGLKEGAKGAVSGGSPMGGWMGILNDWFPDGSLSECTAENGRLFDGAKLRIVYSLDYGADHGSDWSVTEKTLCALAFSAGTLDPAFDKDTRAYTLYLDKAVSGLKVTPTATNKSYLVKTQKGDAWYTRDEFIPITATRTELVVAVGAPGWPGTYDADPAGEYAVTVIHTTAPTLKAGVANPYTANVAPGDELGFSLPEVFEDDNFVDRITVTEPGNVVKTLSTLNERRNYTYTVPAGAAGELRLVFSAYDGSDLKSPDYVARLTVQPKVEKSLRWKASEHVMEATQQVLDATALLATPANMVKDSLAFASSDSKVVRVEGSKLTALKAGTAQITATCKVGERTHRAVLSVLVLGDNYDNFKVSITSPKGDDYELAYGKSVQLKTAISPSAPVRALEWTAANALSEPAGSSPVVKVDANGKVTALRPGNAVVTVKATGYVPTIPGGVSPGVPTADIKIEVEHAKPTGVTIFDGYDRPVSANGTILRLEHGASGIASLSLEATVAPAHADQDVDWKTSDPQLVKVTEGPGGTAEVSIPAGSTKTGTATITAKSDDGNKTATVKVSVVVPVQKLELKEKPVKKRAVQPGGILTKGASVTLEPVFNNGANDRQPTNKKITWTSSNPAVATVSAGGLVKGAGAGYAVIRATAQDDPDLATRYYLRVIAPVTSVKIDQSNFTAVVGDLVTLTATVNGGAGAGTGGGVATHYYWEATGSTKNKITPATGTDLTGFKFKTVDTVTGKTTVTIKVTAHTSQPSGSYAAKSHSVKVTFVPAGSHKALESFAIKKAPTAATNLLVGKKYTPKLSFTPGNASQRNIDWEVTAGTQYVRLDPKTGAVTAIGDSGNDVVTVTGTPRDTSKGAASQTYSLKTVQRATAVKMRNAPASMRVGESRTLAATLLPSGVAPGAGVTWSSSNVKVLRIDAATGAATALAKGTVTVTAKADDGSGKKATAKITVVQPIYAGGMKVVVKAPKTIATDTDNIPVLDAGKKATLAVEFNGGGKAAQPSNNKVTWSLAPTCPAGVAAISGKGVVTALADGVAVLRATAVQDGSTADFKIRVRVPITKLGIGQKGFTLYPGASATVDAIVTPGLGKLSVGQKGLRWSITEGKGVVIEGAADQPRVTLKATGTAKTSATLTVCSAANPSVKKSITVKVDPAAPKVQDVNLNKSTLRLSLGKSEKLKATLDPAKGAGNQNLRWSLVSVRDANGRYVSDPATVLTVDAAGKVTAKGYGSATVVVTTADGGHVATCQVLCVAK